MITWQPNHALDVIQWWIFWPAKHHDITTLRRIDIDNFFEFYFDNFENKDFLDNAVKFVFEYGDEATKQSFLEQINSSTQEKRNEFYKGLSKENLEKILGEFEKLEQSESKQKIVLEP